jgi:HAD superfamily hydrolase (TIGR01509 family)
MPLIFPKPVEAVIFDMDGLLFDTESVFLSAMQREAQEHGVVISHSFYTSVIGLAREHTLTRLREELGADFPAEDFHAASHHRFKQLLQTELQMKPGVVSMLDTLDRLGLARAIATSSMRSSAEHHLDHFGLAARFDAVIAHGDYAQSKPHPAPYLRAAQVLGVDPAHCVAIEDSYHGVRAAAAAGMMAVMVPDMLPPTEEIRQLALHIAQDLVEVRDALDLHI